MEISKLFIRGFNNGYYLAKHEPELLDKVITNMAPINDYLSGLLRGREEYESEHTKSVLKKISELRKDFKGRDRGLERNL